MKRLVKCNSYTAEWQRQKCIRDRAAKLLRQDIERVKQICSQESTKGNAIIDHIWYSLCRCILIVLRSLNSLEFEHYSDCLQNIDKNECGMSLDLDALSHFDVEYAISDICW